MTPTDRPRKNLLLSEGDRVDSALREAVREAVLDHKRAGNPIAVWRDGRVVWLSPEEIPDLPAAES